MKNPCYLLGYNRKERRMIGRMKRFPAFLLACLMGLSLIAATPKAVKADEPSEPVFEENAVGDGFEDTLNTWKPEAPVTESSAKYNRSYGSIAGADRCETAASLATSYDVGPTEVVIVNGWKFPDALSASAYCGLKDAPILLSNIGYLSKATKDYIEYYLGVSPYLIKTITVIGGEFTDGFYNDLKALGYSTASGNLKKIAGKDRYETARLVTKEILNFVENYSEYHYDIPAVAVTTGLKPYDALSFGPWSYAFHIPILLVDKTGQASAETKQLISQFPYVYLLGSENVVAADCAAGKSNIRLAGNDRYQTSQKIADHFVIRVHRGTWGNTGFADGTEAHYVDALTSCREQAYTWGLDSPSPLILTCSNNAEEVVKDFVITRFAGSQSEYYSFSFYGWAGKGKSGEYEQLKQWIESQD